MANSTITLYYGTINNVWKLQPEKLFCIEDIDAYLSNYASQRTTINLMQYQKITMQMELKLDTTQIYAEPLFVNGIRYAVIKNSDSDRKYYFFVKNAEWRAKSSVRLSLFMDILNTYHYGEDYVLNKKTHIHREHKDRLRKISKSLLVEKSYNLAQVERLIVWNVERVIGSLSSHYVGRLIINTERLGDTSVNIFEAFGTDLDSFDYHINDHDGYVEFEFFGPSATPLETPVQPVLSVIDIQLSYTHSYIITARNIDYLSEGVNPVLYKKDTHALMRREEAVNCDWYLVYRNQLEPTESLLTNPIDCYLMPSKKVPTTLNIVNNGRIYASSLQSGLYYYVKMGFVGSVPTITITTKEGVNITSSSSLETDAKRRYAIILHKIDDNKMEIIDLYSERSSTRNVVESYSTHIWNTEYISVSSFPLYYDAIASLYVNETIGNLTADYNTFGGRVNFSHYSWSSSTELAYIDSIESLDRTDAKLIKVIKLPYIPDDIPVVDDKLEINSSNWSYGLITGTSVNALKLNNLNVKFSYNFDAEEFNSPVYDILHLDNITPVENDTRNDELEGKIYHSEFYQPKLVYDSFGFVFQLERINVDEYFNQLNLEHLTIRFTTTTTINSKFMFSFPKYISNELGSEDYNNVMPVARNNEVVLYSVPYINYVRTGFNYDIKSKNRETASNWASVGLGALGVGIGLLFPSVPLKVAGVVASLISTANSVKSAVVNQQSTEQSIQEKMNAYRNTPTSVSGSDDVDLMSEYTENRLKYVLYQVSPQMKELLLDLFYYTGYNSNRLGIPNISSRIHFNFIECDAIFDKVSNMSEDIVSELSNILKTGATFIHKYMEEEIAKWDIEQVLENYETSLFE